MKRWLLCVLLLPSLLPGQPVFLLEQISFEENGLNLSNAFAGGMDQPQISMADLNGDHLQDLLIFDRAGDHVSVFVNTGNPGNPTYQFSPQLATKFPSLRDWVLLRDYDCDGKADIFSALPDSSAITVYRNTSQGNELSFVLAYPKLTVPGGVISVFETDIPAIADVDGDGDLDILNFDNQGSHVRFYENTGGCSSLSFEVNANCWGEFQEAGLSNDITLQTACKRGTEGNAGHSGSTLCAIDVDGDSALELLLGDLNNSNLVYLHNGGTPDFAQMDQVLTAFPAAHPASLLQFPAAFSLDIDDDGRKDLLVAPNAPNISINRENLWWYKNTGTTTAANYSFQQNDFLSETMVDVGSVSYPVWFDYNADGLQDLIIGNYLSRIPGQPEKSGLTLYENIGTATAPAFKLISRNYLDLSALFNPQIFGVYPAFGDLDGDGDQDMIIGEESGAIHYFTNQAGPGNIADFTLTAPFYFGIDVGNSATPLIADVNEDGRYDLVIGEKNGNLEYYENTGTATVPAFGPGNKTFGAVDVMPACCTGYSVPWLFRNSLGDWELLVGSESGGIFHYGNLAGNLNGSFTLLSSQYGNIAEGTRISISGSDITGDGKPEMVIGNLRGGIAIYSTDAANPIETLSVKDSPSVTIYPNPGMNPASLHLRVKPFQPFSLQIFTASGKMIHQSAIRDEAAQLGIPVPALPPGIYLIKLTLNDSRIFTAKWIITTGF